MQTFEQFLQSVHRRVNAQTPIGYDQWVRETDLVDWGDIFAKHRCLEGQLDALKDR